ncbi:MAG TPA: response regulator transcription factor [Nocardioidaceae bacterium]|nr:response regulator transcription factor [Nocardioidaceae bacterium]
MNELCVLVVDDHRVFAETLAVRLAAEPGVRTAVAFSAGEALAVANHVGPDVVLLDYDLDGGCGADIVAELRGLPGAPRVLMVSGSDDAACMVRAIGSGADGWVLKGSRFETLLDAVDKVLDGELYLSPDVVRPVLTHLMGRSHRPAAPVGITGRRDPRGAPGAVGPFDPFREPSFLDALTAREVEVLRCLVAGMSRAEVARHLFISTNTVRTHVQRLLSRAGVHSTLALVAAARDLGVQEIESDLARMA